MLTRSLTRPLVRMVAAAQAIGAGELHGTLDVHRKDEIDFLAKAMQTMSGNLAHTMQELQLREHKLAQLVEELALARNRAKAANHAKSAFLANMSHEIRTPMNGVIGLTDVLIQHPLPPKQQHCVEMIRTSGKALLSIINDILDVSKIEAGKLELETVAFDLREVLAEVIQLLQERAQSKQLQLGYTLSRAMPTALSGDPNRLRQILFNLLGNALKFTEQGKIWMTVTAVADLAEHTLRRFEVSDTGVGIAPESQQSLFEAFSQADVATTRKYGGTGLGLTICKQLVTLMEGETAVQSTLGQGTTFWFTACFGHAGSAELAAAVQSSAMPSMAAPCPTNGCVLVVDDNSVNQLVLQYQLEAVGYEVEVASDGHQALAACQQRAYHLIFMDCQMPELDGYETTAMLRHWEQEHGDHVPSLH